MGTWGWKIFQSDDACDVRDSYKERLIVGETELEAEDSVVSEYSFHEHASLWLPLAVTQWNLGRLSIRTKENAISWIETELSTLDEYWKPEHREKRKNELLRMQKLLCSDMPKRKSLGLPAWAFKCPWPVGSVLQYRLQYLADTDPLAKHYVLLLIQGISNTPPGKIPCECIAVSLYDWSSCLAPVNSIACCSENAPRRVDFVTKAGSRKTCHTILLSKQIIKDNDIKCIRNTPYSKEDILTASPSSPMNSVFENLISRTLKSV